MRGFTDDTRIREVTVPAAPASAQGGLVGYPVVPVPAQPAHVEQGPVESTASPPAVTETLLDSTDARRLESAQIHTKGGWRDHSDGNRITTTRGDKVEVIRGNYKLVVLGRTDVPRSPDAGWDNAAGMELSGGNVDVSGGDLAYGSLPDVLTPAAAGGALPAPSDASRTGSFAPSALETSYEWTANLDGTWGWKQTTNVGLPDGPNNGQTISNTWVAYQETNVGSLPSPVQNIVSTTYAYSMTQTVNLRPSPEGALGIGPGDGSLTQWTNVQNYRSGIVANSSIDNTSAAVTISNAQAAALGINNATAALTQLTSQAVGANAVVNLFGVGVEMDVALLLAQLIVSEICNTTWLSPVVNDTHAVLHNDMHPGVHIDHHSGMHFDLHDGEHATFDLNGAVKITGGPLVRMHGDMEVKIGEQFTSVCPIETAVASQTTHLTTQFLVAP